MRLNKYLASAGLGSRRSVEALVLEGRVKINGQVVTELATQVGPKDVVKVGQRTLQLQDSIHAVLNKPRGYVVTASDEQGRCTIYDCLPPEWPRVYHAGRLDKESEGLLVLTNDGELALALTHPRYKLEKEYEVLLDRTFDMEAHREKLLRGFSIIGGRAKMEKVDLIGPTKLRVILMQGIKRQIRLMLYELGYEVKQLRRLRIGTVDLGRLKPGEWRMLSPKEVAILRAGGPEKRAPRPSTAPAPREHGDPRFRANRAAGGEFIPEEDVPSPAGDHDEEDD